MSLLHADGFGTYGVTESNLTRGVYASVNTLRISLQTTPLRSSLLTHCIRASGTGGPSDDGLRLVLDSSVTELITGCAVNIANAPPNDSENAIFSFRDSSNVVQCTLVIGTNLDLVLKRGGLTGASEVARSSANVLSAGSYDFIECYVRIGNAGSPGGAVEVRVNGQTVINETGVDTSNTATLDLQSISLGPHGGSGAETVYYQDWYVCDLNGSVNNDFLGDTQWVSLFPDSDGAVQDWTPSSGADGYLMIDDATPDDDTTYIGATTAANISEFGVENAPGVTSQVVALITRTLARKEDAGSANHQTSLISTTSSPETETSGADYPTAETYEVYTDIFETDPATGVAWTKAGVDGIRLKVEKTT